MKKIFYIICMIFVTLFIILFFIFNKNRIYKIDSIRVRYAYFTNILSAEWSNKVNDNGNYIDILEFDLRGKEFEKISSLLKKERFNKVFYTNPIIMDKYEVIINDEIKLSFSNYGENFINYSDGNNKYLSLVSYEFINEIENIVNKKAEKNIIKYSSDNMKIIDIKNNNYMIIDEDNADTLNENFRAVKINPSSMLLNNLMEKYIIDLNNGLNIVVYEDSNVCRILDNGSFYYVYFISNIDNVVDELWEVNSDNINSL